MRFDREGRFSALGGRFTENLAAIRARGRRFRARDLAAPPKLSRAEWLVIASAAIAAVLVIGVAFDRISIGRARALPGFVVDLFRIVSEAGKSQWELYPAGVLVLLLLFCRWSAVPRRVGVAWAEIGALSAFVFAAIGGAGLIVNIVKQPIGRGRPPSFDAFGALALQPFQFSYEFQSFPSGHAATGGALIAIGFLIFTRWRIGLLIFGLAIAASRVVVAAHYPSDVTAGLLLGYVFTLWLAARFAHFGWAFQHGPSGTIRARSGAIRRACRSPAAMVVMQAGLVDAIAGRPVFIPALASIGDGGIVRTTNRIGPSNDD